MTLLEDGTVEIVDRTGFIQVGETYYYDFTGFKCVARRGNVCICEIKQEE